MKAKIFSVRFHGDWMPIIKDELYRKLEKEKGRREFSADEYLERAIQSFLDEHPKIRIKHVQCATTPIYFGEPRAGPKEERKGKGVKKKRKYWGKWGQFFIIDKMALKWYKFSWQGY